MNADKRPASNALASPVKNTAPATRFPMMPRPATMGRPMNKQPKPPGGK